MKYILIYTFNVFFSNSNTLVKTFETLEEVENFLNKKSINKEDIIYMGENKPLDYKIVLS